MPYYKEIIANESYGARTAERLLALRRRLDEPKELDSIPGRNVPKNKHYDQIAFLQRRHEPATTGQAGVFDFFETVYRDEDEAVYAELMAEPYRKAKNPGSYYRSKWRTYQMSDHLPMWVELRTQWVEETLAGRVRA